MIHVRFVPETDITITMSFQRMGTGQKISPGGLHRNVTYKDEAGSQ